MDYLDERLYDFTGLEDSKVSCQCGDLFNQKVKEALVPVIKECLSFYIDQAGRCLTLAYNVETRKYYWNGEEYETLPEAFKQKGEQ